MFLIQNITQKQIAIGDLRIVLRPGQKLDVDKMCPRQTSEQSNGLHIALSKKLIKILNKDSMNGSTIVKQKPEIVIDKNPSISKEDLDGMEKRITDNFIQQMSKQVSKQQEEYTGDNQGVQSIMEQLAQVIQNAQTGSEVIQPSNIGEIDTTLTDEEMTEIHSRAVSKKTEHSKGNIEAEKTSRKININDMADELEGLL